MALGDKHDNPPHPQPRQPRQPRRRLPLSRRCCSRVATPRGHPPKHHVVTGVRAADRGNLTVMGTGTGTTFEASVLISSRGKRTPSAIALKGGWLSNLTWDGGSSQENHKPFAGVESNHESQFGLRPAPAHRLRQALPQLARIAWVLPMPLKLKRGMFAREARNNAGKLPGPTPVRPLRSRADLTVVLPQPPLRVNREANIGRVRVLGCFGAQEVAEPESLMCRGLVSGGRTEVSLR